MELVPGFVVGELVVGLVVELVVEEVFAGERGLPFPERGLPVFFMHISSWMGFRVDPKRVDYVFVVFGERKVPLERKNLDVSVCGN